MKAITIVKSSIVLVSTAAIFMVPGVASAHHGSASGSCKSGVGVITVNFESFDSKLVDGVTVKVNDKQVDKFNPTAVNFSKVYNGYTEGQHTVMVSWATDWNKNGKVDETEAKSFTKKVVIENCKPEVPKCDVPGKGNLPKNDPNCKEDKCTVAGKTHLPKSDPNCKEDKCTVAGKTNLPKNDPNCKEDKCTVTGKTDLKATDPNCKEEPEVLPNTGIGSGVAGLFAGVSAAGAGLHSVVSRRRKQ